MNYFDDEEKIIYHFQCVDKREVHLVDKTRDVISVFEAIYNADNWKKWINNSAKENLPPDFFSNEYELMMEVMRVDDHAHYDENGVLVNPVNKRESILQKEIRQKILSHNPNADLTETDIYINALSGLPSNEDHNYQFYSDSFARVLKKHIKHIPLYRKNHPNKKLIFFVFDESTGYVTVDDENLVKRGPKALESFTAEPLWHFLDSKFINVFKNCDIDYFIWYTPYKIFHGTTMQPPKVCIYDLKNHLFDNIVTYPENLIISAEA